MQWNNELIPLHLLLLFTYLVQKPDTHLLVHCTVASATTMTGSVFICGNSVYFYDNVRQQLLKDH